MSPTASGRSEPGNINLDRIEAAEAEHLALYGGEVARFGPVVAADAGPGLPVNFACGFGRSLEALEAVEAFYAARGLPSRVVLYSRFGPWDRLADRGYRLLQVLHVHARDLTDVPPPALTVRPAPPAEFARLSALAFGPGSEAIMERTSRRAQTRFYTAELDGRPAAAGAMSVFGDLALCFSTATLPEHRGRGAQTALLAARLLDARDLGATHAAVLTTPGSASERNVWRAGFVQLGARLTLERA